MIGLKEIYHPIAEDLQKVEEIFETSLGESRTESILKVNRFLLESPGRRLRPALVILSAKATLNHQSVNLKTSLSKIASAVELIHLASLIHDDVIDHAILRHSKPTVNYQWGTDVAISLGDYLYAEAFRLIADCGNAELIRCLSAATKQMCEGELNQVCERDNFDLLKRKYILIIKKKTAALFAASCQAGTMLYNCPNHLQNALKQYGLNFGIAFQIVDDCLDLIGKEDQLGKLPGADFNIGELTLPILNLLSETKDKNKIWQLLVQPDKKKSFEEIKQRFLDSSAFNKTKKEIEFYIYKAKDNLTELSSSRFKQSLTTLTDYIANRVDRLWM